MKKKIATKGKKKTPLCYGDYGNKSDSQLVKIHNNIFKLFDKYLESKHRKATTLERIEIRGLQHALRELCRIERELTLREEDPR